MEGRNNLKNRQKSGNQIEETPEAQQSCTRGQVMYSEANGVKKNRCAVTSQRSSVL